MQQVEGGEIPRGRSVSSFAIPQEKREQKLRQKQGEKNTNAGCLGEEKKKNDPLHNLNKMVCHLDDWPATLFPNIL